VECNIELKFKNNTMRSQFGNIYKGKRILITGHTGFKGSWLSMWLNRLGANVYGYALAPPTRPSLFELLQLEREIEHQEADIRDQEQLVKSIGRIKPDIIFHLAAQSLVRESYLVPYITIETNVIGTLNVLEAVRKTGVSTAVVAITSDKCYENKEWMYGYRENDPLGGYDPYSSSKAAAEILISSWRNSFFNPDQLAKHGVRIASARAGNVLGGGDWNKDHILSDCINLLQRQKAIRVRNPNATRPWQHVLEPLSGYLELGAKLLSPRENVAPYCEAFNFGPLVTSNKSVRELVEKIIEYWGEGSWELAQSENVFHEAHLLNLSIDKSYSKLRWTPRWDFEKTVAKTIEWYKVMEDGSQDLRHFTLSQIESYETDLEENFEPLTQAEMKKLSLARKENGK
jgi:CDP-glucose 4,6-dehydratase